MFIFIRHIYHLAMATYYGWRLRADIRRLRRAGKVYNLPSLDEYSDEAIIQGCINLREEQQKEQQKCQ